MHMSIGPIEYVVVGFPGNKFKGEIVPALAELVENGTIRILDLVFILKDEEGNVAAVELADLDPADEAAAMADISEVNAGLLNEDDIALAAEALESNSSAGLLVFENVWATRFAEAVRNANGQLLANERVPYDVVQAALAHAAAESGEES
jgi:translation initiation factor IF-2